MWELDHEEGWALKNCCFWTVVLEKTLECPLDSKEIKSFNPKGNQPWISLEGLMLKLRLQYFGHLKWRANSLEKTLMLGKTDGRRRKGMAEDEMVGWHHQLSGHEFEQTLRDSEGQESLACFIPWGCNKLNTSEWLSRADLQARKERDSEATLFVKCSACNWHVTFIFY